MSNIRKIHKKIGVRTILAIAVAAVMVGQTRQASADKAGDLRREQLAKVKRLAVLPLFFGSETLREAKPNAPKLATKQDKPEKSDKEKQEYEQNLEAFRAHLRKMEARANERLPERIVERTGFKVVPEKEQAQALETAELKPYQLFQNDGIMKGIKFPLPDTEAIKKLAKSLKADALLLGIMEEPRRDTGGQGSFFSFRIPHVSARIIYYVFLPDGTESFRYTIDVARPLSRIGTRDYSLVDWYETVDHNVENFLDEFVRYTPAK
jgi:hypothetical protein